MTSWPRRFGCSSTNTSRPTTARSQILSPSEPSTGASLSRYSTHCHRYRWHTARQPGHASGGQPRRGSRRAGCRDTRGARDRPQFPRRSSGRRSALRRDPAHRQQRCAHQAGGRTNVRPPGASTRNWSETLSDWYANAVRVLRSSSTVQVPTNTCTRALLGNIATDAATTRSTRSS